MLPSALFAAIQIELERHHTGIKEYDLLMALKRHGFFDFLDDAPVPPLVMFRAHFLLFHALYLLRDDFLAEQSALLKIDVLKIQMIDYEPGLASLCERDALRDYYLDITQLENTSEDEIFELLANFWNRMKCHGQRDQALATMGLADPVSDQVIKKTYRRLVMRHHPDRGGETSRLQEINAALSILLAT